MALQEQQKFSLSVNEFETQDGMDAEYQIEKPSLAEAQILPEPNSCIHMK